MPSSKPGKTTSKTSQANKRPTDPIDRLIHERGLRIKDVYIDKALDLMLLVLNNGTVIRSGIAEHKRLKGVPQPRLEKWNLIAGGTGLNWPELDEDLSLRGFIHASYVDQAIRSLDGPLVNVMSSAKRTIRRA